MMIPWYEKKKNLSERKVDGWNAVGHHIHPSLLQAVRASTASAAFVHNFTAKTIRRNISRRHLEVWSARCKVKKKLLFIRTQLWPWARRGCLSSSLLGRCSLMRKFMGQTTASPLVLPPEPAWLSDYHVVIGFFEKLNSSFAFRIEEALKDTLRGVDSNMAGANIQRPTRS